MNRVKERKPPARGGFTPSKRVVPFDALRQIGAARLKRKGVSPSADGDLRLCLKNSRTFEKVRSKLSAVVDFYLDENFRLRKFTFNFAAGEP